MDKIRWFSSGSPLIQAGLGEHHRDREHATLRSRRLVAASFELRIRHVMHTYIYIYQIYAHGWYTHILAQGDSSSHHAEQTATHPHEGTFTQSEKNIQAWAALAQSGSLCHHYKRTTVFCCCWVPARLVYCYNYSSYLYSSSFSFFDYDRDDNFIYYHHPFSDR